MKVTIALCAAVGASFLSTLFVSTASSFSIGRDQGARDAVTFNQFELQEEFLLRRKLFSHFSLEYLHSMATRVLEAPSSSAPNARVIPTKFDRSNPKDIFEEVFFHAPPVAYVYPTETYYYFYFTRDDFTIAGNFRFVDAHEGKLHIGYYDKNDPHSDFMGAATFTEKDGVSVELTSAHVVSVKYQGVVRLFHLNPTAQIAPHTLKLQDDEEFIARIFDESGFEFFLIFNDSTSSFYYLLSEESPLPENLLPGPKSYSLAPKSSFVFYTDSEFGRTILVGVHEKNIYFNNYYDGPFDQLPPRLNIRKKLHRAYPYCKERGGIDEHGNFLTIEGTRVAISPYTPYRELSSLLRYQKRCFARTDNRSELWSCLSYEWKHDFHRTPDDPYGDGAYRHHVVPQSQGWPANHWGTISRRWPKEHSASQSSSWKPNHQDFLE